MENCIKAEVCAFIIDIIIFHVYLSFRCFSKKKHLFSTFKTFSLSFVHGRITEHHIKIVHFHMCCSSWIFIYCWVSVAFFHLYIYIFSSIPKLLRPYHFSRLYMLLNNYCCRKITLVYECLYTYIHTYIHAYLYIELI